MKTKFIIIIMLFAAICSLPSAICYALDLGFAKEDGGRPGAFLQYGAGARSLGMGKTFVGISDDASAVYWNPAGLAQLKNSEISLLHASLYENSGYDFLSFGVPFNARKSAFGIALVNLSSTGFQLKNELNVDQGEGGVNEAAGMMSLAHSWAFLGDSRIHIGSTVKMVRQNIDTKSASGFGLDAGFLWGPGSPSGILEPLSIGLSVQNLVAPKLKLVNEEDKFPLSATLGIAYRLASGKCIVAVDVNKTQNRNVKPHFGTEIRPIKSLALRAGIDETEISAGFGFNWQNYSLDYAFAYHDALKGVADLGASHRFGLSIKFGKLQN